jgi:hypothetical protein
MDLGCGEEKVNNNKKDGNLCEMLVIILYNWCEIYGT